MEKLVNNFSTNDINWNVISVHQKLSEKFINKYINKLDFTFILKYQNLSEDTMEKIKQCQGEK